MEEENRTYYSEITRTQKKTFMTLTIREKCSDVTNNVVKKPKNVVTFMKLKSEHHEGENTIITKIMSPIPKNVRR